MLNKPAGAIFVLGGLVSLVAGVVFIMNDEAEMVDQLLGISCVSLGSIIFYIGLKLLLKKPKNQRNDEV